MTDTTATTQKVKLSKAGLTHDITVTGLTRPQLSAKYGISVGQINRALKQVGLSDLRPGKVAFEIVEEEVASLTPEPQPSQSNA